MQSTTTREEFRALAAEHRVVPVTRKVLADSETPLSAYRKLAANRPGTFLLESAENGRSWSRWSFIGAGAPSALTIRDGHAVWLGHTPTGAPTGGDPLQALQQTIELLSTGPLAGVAKATDESRARRPIVGRARVWAACISTLLDATGGCRGVLGSRTAADRAEVRGGSRVQAQPSATV